jgi:hypothetical protein
VTAIVADLHWLVHQGHVIEFANGALETAKKPLPRPPKPAPADAATSAPTAQQPVTTEGENQPQAAEASAATEAITAQEEPSPAAPEIAASTPEA